LLTGVYTQNPSAFQNQVFLENLKLGWKDVKKSSV